jgi:hypothetical protein
MPNDRKISCTTNLLSNFTDRLSIFGSELKKLLSIPRRKLDQEELVEILRDVRGEIDRLESELHAKS